MELPAFLLRTKKPDDTNASTSIGLKTPVYDKANYNAIDDTYTVDGKTIPGHEFRMDRAKHVDTDTNKIVSERMADHMKMRDKGRREILGVKVPPVPEPVKHTPRQIFVQDPHKESDEDDVMSDIATGVAIAEVIADLSDLGSSDSGSSDSSIDAGGGDFGGGGSDSSW